MRIVQSLQLQKTSEEIKDFFSARKKPSVAFLHIAEAKDYSLQDESYDQDEKLFSEISSLTGVIASIISRPHVATKREEIVTRIDQAKSIAPDDFARVCRDGSLWKRRNLKMIPEEIYYFQHTDELAIYENKFIVLLIDAIDKELVKYKRFYAEELPLITDDNAELCAAKISKIMSAADKLGKRIAFLKETYFYKIISAEKALTGKIKPTNILIKDGRYRLCYKFYNDFIKYNGFDGNDDLVLYYALHALKAFAALGAKPKKGEFLLNGFSVALDYKDGLTLTVTDVESGKQAKHLLAVKGGAPINEYDTITLADVWAFTTPEGERLFRQGLSERELVTRWIETVVRTVTVDGETYKKYCPVCAATNLSGDGKISCARCGSEFTYVKRGKKDAIWLLKLRRKQ